MDTRRIRSGIINRNSLWKTIVYRIYSSVIVFLISLVITGNLLISFTIGFFETIIKLFSYYFFDVVWSKLTVFRANPSVIWLTGTNENNIILANELSVILKSMGIVPIILNGSDLNKSKEIGIEEEPGGLAGMDISQLASLFKSQGNVVIASPSLPHEVVVNELRKTDTDFIEILVTTDIRIHTEKNSLLKNKINLSGKMLKKNDDCGNYFISRNSDIVFDTNGHSINESINKLLKILKR